MPGILSTRKRRLQINKFVLNVADKQKPVFGSYKKLDGIWRRIDYLDFEWKYYQYYHGNRNLSIRRSPENSSPLTFSDLPMDVLKKVVEKSALADRLALRKVSRDLRILVDSTEVHCENVIFRFGTGYSKIKLDESEVYYDEEYDDFHRNPNNIFKKIKKNQNYPKTMIADALTFLKNPKLKIGDLRCEVYGDGALSEFSEFLKSLDFQLDVRSIYIYTVNGIIPPILKVLRPKALEEISLDTYKVTIDKFNEIAETEQWKMARKLHWKWFLRGFRMETLLHFKEIRIDYFDFADENLIMVREILLKSVHLQICHLTTHYFGGQEKKKKRIDGILSQDPAYDIETGRFSMPDSRDYFQLKFEMCNENFELTITRISKNE